MVRDAAAVEFVADTDREVLDRVFFALSDQVRRAILERLDECPLLVSELAAPFAISLQAVSRHIQVLERAGLVSRTRHRQTRPCRLEPNALRSATDWIDRQRELWSERFDLLEQHLTDLRSDRKKP